MMQKTTENKYNKKSYIIEKISGYAIIPAEKYELVSPGDHIRYIGIDGNFRTGGYIWSKKTTDDGLDYWIIGQTRNVNMKSKHFILYWNKIRKLWKRISPETDLLRMSIDRKQDYIQDISTFLLKKYGEEFRKFMMERERLRKTNQK